ncbi:MAG: hypothetical protein IK144_04630 [Bacteroidaceae bacterium]|nr:hypothetical protein [Bacteroidaceae bacterium]
MKQTIITIMLALVAFAANAAVPDSLRKDLEDYDYLVSFVENNYVPFDAIMQKGYKREYKSLKKQIRAQLCKGESDLEKAATDYIIWFYSQFDRHIAVGTTAFEMAADKIMYEAFLKMDSTLATVGPDGIEYAPKPVSCKVDSLTWLIRVPSCHPDYYEWTINALQQFDESDCVNLIIDVRGNEGGGDTVWHGYYDMLYDHPGKPSACWFRNTPENLKYWKDIVANLQTPEVHTRNLIKECESSKKKFMKWGEDSGDTGRKPTTRIRRAAVLIDIMTASAGESIVDFVKNHSDRAKVYGISNTHGSNLTGNCWDGGVLPNSKIRVGYATTIDSGFYEKDFSEGIGIVPDVIIPLPYPRKLTDNIDEWVLWVAEDLKKSSK